MCAVLISTSYTYATELSKGRMMTLFKQFINKVLYTYRIYFQDRLSHDRVLGCGSATSACPCLALCPVLWPRAWTDTELGFASEPRIARVTCYFSDCFAFKNFQPVGTGSQQNEPQREPSAAEAASPGIFRSRGAGHAGRRHPAKRLQVEGASARPRRRGRDGSAARRAPEPFGLRFS